MESTFEKSVTNCMLSRVRRLGTLACFVILMLLAALIEMVLTILTTPEDAGTPIIVLETVSIILLINAMIIAISSTRLPKQDCKICFPSRPTWNGNFDVEVHQRITSLLNIGFRNWFCKLERDSEAKVGLTWRLFVSTVNCTGRALKDGNKSVSVTSHLLESEKHTQRLITHVRKKTREFDVGVTVNRVQLSFMKRLILAIILRRNPLSFPPTVTRLVFSTK